MCWEKKPVNTFLLCSLKRAFNWAMDVLLQHIVFGSMFRLRKFSSLKRVSKDWGIFTKYFCFGNILKLHMQTITRLWVSLLSYLSECEIVHKQIANSQTGKIKIFIFLAWFGHVIIVICKNSASFRGSN